MCCCCHAAVYATTAYLLNHTQRFSMPDLLVACRFCCPVLSCAVLLPADSDFRGVAQGWGGFVRPYTVVPLHLQHRRQRAVQQASGDAYCTILWGLRIWCTLVELPPVEATCGSNMRKQHAKLAWPICVRSEIRPPKMQQQSSLVYVLNQRMMKDSTPLTEKYTKYHIRWCVVR